MMKLSHVLYKTNALDETVKKFEAQGFRVEYGSKKNPNNALIYFSEGPYIELISHAPVPWYSMIVLRLIGKGKVADRFKKWNTAAEGYFGICLENYGTDLKQEAALLKGHGHRFFTTKSSRKDPQNRTLRWKLLFPYELKLPFLMTYFNIDPKPKDFTHPNGIRKIKTIHFGTDPNLFSVIQALCDDNRLILLKEEGICKLQFE